MFWFARIFFRCFDASAVLPVEPTSLETSNAIGSDSTEYSAASPLSTGGLRRICPTESGSPMGGRQDLECWGTLDILLSGESIWTESTEHLNNA